MLRFGSLLMVLLLTVPMARDCCLPITHSWPCHESKRSGDETCFSGQQAIAQNKPTLAPKFSVEHQLFLTEASHTQKLRPTRRAADRDIVAEKHMTDIYLRTGALLI